MFLSLSRNAKKGIFASLCWSLLLTATITGICLLCDSSHNSNYNLANINKLIENGTNLNTFRTKKPQLFTLPYDLLSSDYSDIFQYEQFKNHPDAMQNLFNLYLISSNNLTPTSKFYEVNIEPYKWRKMNVSNYSVEKLKNDIKTLWPRQTFNEATGITSAAPKDYIFGAGMYYGLSEEAQNNLKRIVIQIKNIKKKIKNNPNDEISGELEAIDFAIQNHENHCISRLLAIINETSRRIDIIETLLDNKNNNFDVNQAIVTEFKKIAFDKTAMTISRNFGYENVMAMNSFKQLYKNIFNLKYSSSDFGINFHSHDITFHEVLQAFSNNIRCTNLSSAAKNILSLTPQESQEKLYNDILTVELSFDKYCKIIETDFGKVNLEIDPNKLEDFVISCMAEIDDNDENYNYWKTTFNNMKKWVDKKQSISLEDLNNIYMVFFDKIDNPQNNMSDLFKLFNTAENNKTKFIYDNPQILFLHLEKQGFFLSI